MYIAIYLAFTTAWTVMVIVQASTIRRIRRRAIQPLERLLMRRGLFELPRRLIIGLLQLSIIPLGMLWLIFLLYPKRRTT
ncbi:MAG: hypothetical protein RLZZ511_509 [Cyanobacteriota bacterium]|jgi:hypothetical protein